MQKLRLHFRTYAQRQEGVEMKRIKIPGGLLTILINRRDYAKEKPKLAYLAPFSVRHSMCKLYTWKSLR